MKDLLDYVVLGSQGELAGTHPRDIASIQVHRRAAVLERRG